jgi:hypothetical protein
MLNSMGLQKNVNLVRISFKIKGGEGRQKKDTVDQRVVNGL